MRKMPTEQVVRATRVYRTNKDASTALGITPRAFARLCRELGIDTPGERRQNRCRSFSEEKELSAEAQRTVGKAVRGRLAEAEPADRRRDRDPNSRTLVDWEGAPPRSALADPVDSA